MSQNNQEEQTKLTFTDLMRERFKGIIVAIAIFLNNLGIHPNLITTVGLLGNIAGAVLIAFGKLWIAGLVVLLLAPMDAFDGTMARLKGEITSWGAFVDSVVDRYSELILIAGMIIYFWQKPEGPDILHIFVAYFAACGSVLVSYVKSRAEGLGVQVKVGLLSRLERYLVIIPCLLFGFPEIAVWILAVLGNYTALQRIYHVRKKVYKKPSELLKNKKGA